MLADAAADRSASGRPVSERPGDGQARSIPPAPATMGHQAAAPEFSASAARQGIDLGAHIGRPAQAHRRVPGILRCVQWPRRAVSWYQKASFCRRCRSLAIFTARVPHRSFSPFAAGRQFLESKEQSLPATAKQPSTQADVRRTAGNPAMANRGAPRPASAESQHCSRQPTSVGVLR